MRIVVDELPARLSATPYNTGGELCSAGQSVAWVCRVGPVTFEVTCPDDCSTWSNHAHDGPRSGMRDGTPIPKPRSAIGYIVRAWDTINGGRRWTTIVAPTPREAATCAYHLGLPLGARYDSSVPPKHKKDFARRSWRAYNRDPYRQRLTEGRHWDWASHLEALRVHRAGEAASKGLWRPEAPTYATQWVRKLKLP